MTELLESLYTFAAERRMRYTFEEKARYNESRQMSDRAYEELQALLPEQGRQVLENYIGEEQVIRNLQLDAMFRAGLSVGLELNPSMVNDPR